MAQDSQDVILHAFATLKSLRSNIGQMTEYDVPEIYVNEYHTVLDRLEGLGIDVSEFRIPVSEVRQRETGGSYVTGEKWYSEEKYVERSLLLVKLDAILGYFEIITSDKPKTIGFHKPGAQ